MSFIDDITGEAVIGFQMIDGDWYCFDQAGIMITNQWQQDAAGVLYYFGADGRMLTGWNQIDGLWYNL